MSYENFGLPSSLMIDNSMQSTENRETFYPSSNSNFFQSFNQSTHSNQFQPPTTPPNQNSYNHPSSSQSHNNFSTFQNYQNSPPNSYRNQNSQQQPPRSNFGPPPKQTHASNFGPPPKYNPGVTNFFAPAPVAINTAPIPTATPMPTPTPIPEPASAPQYSNPPSQSNRAQTSPSYGRVSGRSVRAPPVGSQQWENCIQAICDMGFTRDQAADALKKAGTIEGSISYLIDGTLPQGGVAASFNVFNELREILKSDTSLFFQIVQENISLFENLFQEEPEIMLNLFEINQSEIDLEYFKFKFNQISNRLNLQDYSTHNNQKNLSSYNNISKNDQKNSYISERDLKATKVYEETMGRFSPEEQEEIRNLTRLFSAIEVTQIPEYYEACNRDFTTTQILLESMND